MISLSPQPQHHKPATAPARGLRERVRSSIPGIAKIGMAPANGKLSDAPLLWGKRPSSGLVVPHLRQAPLRANTRSLQLGQCQSPGFSHWLLPPPPATAAPAASIGFRVPQRRHASFRANWRSLQPGHNQSPGLAWWEFRNPPEGLTLETSPDRSPCWLFNTTPAVSGFAIPQRRHCSFRAN